MRTSQVSVACPVCTTINEVMASSGVGDAQIGCSQCGKALGTWAMLSTPRDDRKSESVDTP